MSVSSTKTALETKWGVLRSAHLETCASILIHHCLNMQGTSWAAVSPRWCTTHLDVHMSQYAGSVSGASPAQDLHTCLGTAGVLKKAPTPQLRQTEPTRTAGLWPCRRESHHHTGSPPSLVVPNREHLSPFMVVPQFSLQVVSRRLRCRHRVGTGGPAGAARVHPGALRNGARSALHRPRHPE